LFSVVVLCCCSLLLFSVVVLCSSVPVPETAEEMNRRLRLASQETCLWSDILTMTWDLKLLPLVTVAARQVLTGPAWDPVDFKEIVLLQIEGHFIRAQASVESIRQAPGRWWQNTIGVDHLHPKALGLYSGGDIALSKKMLALKEQVIASCVTGCTLAVALKETSLVENAAVYLWNFHLHIFRDISGVKPSPLRFDKMLPSLTAALDSTLSALQAVASSDVPLLCHLCEALALIHEHHNDTTAVHAVCQTAVTAAAGTPLHARPLINIAARVGGGKGGVGGGDPVLELIAVVQRLTLHPEAALLVSGMAML
jgi:hypothetical protein